MGGNRNARKEAKEERESSKAVAVKSKADKAADDAFWSAAGDGVKGKGASKKEEEERKKAEAAAKKAEAKRLLEEEEAGMSKAKAKAGPKLTKYEMDRQREKEEKERAAKMAGARTESRREMTEEEYARMVDGENTNRNPDEASATSVTGALEVLGVNDKGAVDAHPEKRMKAAFKAYEERVIPELRAEKPGLKMTQYKDLVWNKWKKAPENPMNQAK